MKGLAAFYPDLQPDSERTCLEQRLHFCRRAAVVRIEDLSDEQAASRPLPATRLSVGGIIKHLACAEDRWFVGKFLGRELPEPWRSAPLATDPDWPFESSSADSVADLVSLYEQACGRSRSAAEHRPLHALAAVASFGQAPVSLRWLLVHMIDETAWHLGHLDLLRDALGLPPAPS